MIVSLSSHRAAKAPRIDFELADHHQVDRIARARPAAIGRRRRHRAESLDERDKIAFDQRIGGANHSEIVVPIVDRDAGHGDRECEIDGRLRRDVVDVGQRQRGFHQRTGLGDPPRDIQRPVDGMQTNANQLRAGIGLREHESLGRAPRRNRAEMKRLAFETCVHPPIGAAGRDVLQRDQQQQGQKKDPADQPERREPLGNREVIHSGRLERREVVRIERQQVQPKRMSAAIDDPQVDRLNPAPSQRHAEHAMALPLVEHRDRHFRQRAFLRLRSCQKVTTCRLRRIADQENALQSGDRVLDHASGVAA